ncbi:ATP-grasp domain-containing protein [Actinomadura parmotrematis]|uniref:ATP-grasp domain-containing protein n=1 Tax=Actinomadura parmotrematis TaxID=2864039 RepID=A0ABS7FLD0_9ACTN|nr:ATP-grasp domain-containing protein [Actinomadura parmotrematis]MBW8481168.1 ATP-grasp domain-containing protein [Actinomadura parmotrematis]
MSGPLLVLGAAEEQIPLYEEARRRGVRTIAVDRRADRPAIAHADAFLRVSTHDPDAIAAALRDERPAGVVAAASDNGLRAWHALCLRYRTPYVYPAAAIGPSTNKAAFHALAREAGAAGYGWTCSPDPAVLAGRAAALRFPLVVKPADGSGSKGVRRVADPAALPAAIAHARAFARDGRVIAEEAVAGRHLVVETFRRGGAACYTAVLEKDFVPGTDYVVRRLTCPADLDAATEAALAALAGRLCAALGVVDGPADFDVVLPPAGPPVVIEVNARLGGNGIPRLLRAALGVDGVAALVALALGEPCAPVPTRSRHALLELVGSPLDRDGELADAAGLSAARAVPGVTDAELFAAPGDLVRPFDQSGHKIGHVAAAGDTAAAAREALERALRELRLTVLPLPDNAPEGDLHVLH